MNNRMHDRLNDPGQLITPCLLVYPEIVESNLSEMIRIAGGAVRLRPHVKTHKTREITRMELDQGITKHKCATLAEAEMLGECAASDVLIAYPQLGPAASRFVSLCRNFPNTRFSTVVDCQAAVEQLEWVLAREEFEVDVLIDVDTGMHRTGIELGERARSLWQSIEDSAWMRAGGLHVYDGQNHQSDVAQRQAAVDQILESVARFVQQVESAGGNVARIVCGGTPTFGMYAAANVPRLNAAMEVSPGTCVLSDYNYGKDYRDLEGIRHAALLLTRVISKHGPDQLTLDLGYKAIASDPPAGARCHFPELKSVRELQQNEEHLMIATPDAAQLAVGDVVYVLPAHICPTVALHSELQIVRNGQIVDQWPVAARHRLYR